MIIKHNNIILTKEVKNLANKFDMKDLGIVYIILSVKPTYLIDISHLNLITSRKYSINWLRKMMV